MNFRSSSAKTLVGSVIAIVSVAPTRLSGMIWYLWAVSAGTSLMTAGSISNWFSEIDGTPYCLREQRRDLLVLDEAELHQIGAQLAAALALVAQRLLELFGRDPLLLEKQLADPYRHVSCPPFFARCAAPADRPWLGGPGRRWPLTGVHDCTPALRVPAPITFSVCSTAPADLSAGEGDRPMSSASHRPTRRSSAGAGSTITKRVGRPTGLRPGPAPRRGPARPSVQTGSPSQSGT